MWRLSGSYFTFLVWNVSRQCHGRKGWWPLPGAEEHQPGNLLTMAMSYGLSLFLCEKEMKFLISSCFNQCLKPHFPLCFLIDPVAVGCGAEQGWVRAVLQSRNCLALPCKQGFVPSHSQRVFVMPWIDVSGFFFFFSFRNFSLSWHLATSYFSLVVLLCSYF